MTTFACRSCGATDSFQVFEMAPRHRGINVVGDAHNPVEDDGPSDSDEVFYEASEFRAYRCDACGAEQPNLSELVRPTSS